MGISYLIGDATQPVRSGPAILVHVCNDAGKWGAGFVLALSRRWPQPEAAYRAWSHGAGNLPFALGQVQFVPVTPDLWVANVIGQHGVRSAHNPVPIRYDAVRAGLAQVAAFARQHGASVHMPRIGCGLAGGTWDQMEPIIREELADPGIAVTVYDPA